MIAAGPAGLSWVEADAANTELNDPVAVMQHICRTRELSFYPAHTEPAAVRCCKQWRRGHFSQPDASNVLWKCFPTVRCAVATLTPMVQAV